MRVRLLFVGSLLALVTACGEGEERDPGGVDAGDPPRTALWDDGPSLPVPAEGEGMQLHFGPADLDDPAEVERFVLAPGEESVDCGFRRASNAADAFFSGYEASLRPGAHHVLVNAATADAPIGDLESCVSTDTSVLFATIQGGADPGGERLRYPSADQAAAPENRGLASRLPAGQMISVQAHFVNSTDTPLLREIWMNLTFVDPSEVVTLADRFALYTGTRMHVPPHERQVVHGACAYPEGASGDVRILDVFGHMHAHGQRISAWHVPESGAGDAALFYESFDWEGIERYAFDSVSQNPEPTAAARRGGAASGVLLLRPGERIEFECEIDNTEDFALEFAARTYTAEMCALFGSYAPGLPSLWTCVTD